MKTLTLLIISIQLFAINAFSQVLTKCVTITIPASLTQECQMEFCITSSVTCPEEFRCNPEFPTGTSTYSNCISDGQTGTLCFYYHGPNCDECTISNSITIRNNFTGQTYFGSSGPWVDSILNFLSGSTGSLPLDSWVGVDCGQPFLEYDPTTGGYIIRYH